ncbi:MarC family NAAT transporter [Orrella marina]|uniref:UPF0056 membrane protein n=1 Tax=Orrella marina TaxID=2163011 RepID=A0A2R4XNH2_9BURK|nr:MarC family NAAT transporter [Orrella marina]AWB35321.1 stress protection protein MarC [Orrella marina]
MFSHLIVLGLVMMLPLSNPLTSMSLLLALGKDLSHFERARQVRQAAIYVVAIMLVTYYAGTFILSAFSISLPGMRIAGGLIVAYIGFRMLFPSVSVAEIPEANSAMDSVEGKTVPNLAFVPLAMPGTAGPGTMAMIMSAASKVHSVESIYPGWMLMVVPIIIALLLGLLFYVCLGSADRIVALIGQDGVEAISRIMGFLLVCMAVQFVIDGVIAVIHDPHGFAQAKGA